MTNQQLKAHCEDVIANPQDHSEMVLDMATALLPCLEAVPTYVRLFGHYGYGDRCWLECGKSEEGAQPFYTAPPVPELKPIDLRSRLNSLMFNDDVMFGYNKARAEDIEAILAAGYEVTS